MKKKTIIDFICEAKKVHGDKYGYDKSIYVKNNHKLIIECPEHGEFIKTPIHHVNRRQGCPTCSHIEQYDNQTKDNNTFILEAKKVHGDKYSYNKVVYKHSKKHVDIECVEHGIFKQTPDNHLSGRGCKFCSDTFKLSGDEFKAKLNEIYDSNIYIISDYINSSTLSEFKCVKHGVFLSTPNNLLNKKRGCPYCSSSKIFDLKSFIDKSNLIHNNLYTYDKSKFVNMNTPLDIYCSNHGFISVTPYYHINSIGCDKCSNGHSVSEKEVYSFVESLHFNVVSNTRKIITPLELDIFVPEKNIAIEYNGLYWHSEIHKDKKYHLSKTKVCEENGIQLIHIFEDEWLYKQEIVKSRLKNLLGLTENKIYARKCEVREVKTKDKTKFLNYNHIQGAVGSKINLGLYFNDELVSIMTFGKRPFLNDYEYELIRFCNKLNTSVVGGASKLLKHFLRVYNPNELISYADRRWSTGNLYEKLGFKFVSDTQPNWFIVNGKNREHRVKYQKHKLVNMGFDGGKTAHEICIENGLYRIYDCGTKKFIFELQ